MKAVKLNLQRTCPDLSPNSFLRSMIYLRLSKRKSQKKNATKRDGRLSNLERVRTYLEKFATGGRYAQLWNGSSTLESNENFVVFNFQSLFASKNYIVINAQMLLLLRYLEQKIINIREINRNNPTKIYTR